MSVSPDVSIVLSPSELSEHLHEVIMIDVRTPGEYAGLHIPGSYNVPLDRLSEHAPRLTAAIGDPVVLICRSGMRARQAEQTLRAHDLPRLRVLDGGIESWRSASLPLNQAQQRAAWSMERQVRAAAGSIGLLGALGGLVLWQPLTVVAAGIGGGLLFSALTDTCTMARILDRMPWNQRSTATCDIDAVVHQFEAFRPSRDTV